MMKLITILLTLSLIESAAAQAQTSGASTSAPGWRIGVLPAMALTEGEVESVDMMHGEVVIHHGDLPKTSPCLR